MTKQVKNSHWALTITLATCLTISMAWIIGLWTNERGKQLALSDHDREIAGLTSTIAEQTALAVSDIVLAVQPIETLHADKSSRNGSNQLGRDFLREQIKYIPQIKRITIFDKDGHVAATSVDKLVENKNLSENSNFKSIRNGSNIIFRKLTSFQGENIYGTLVINLRLKNERGDFNGMAEILIEEQYFKQIFTKIGVARQPMEIQLLNVDDNPLVTYQNQADLLSDSDWRSSVSAVPDFPLAIRISCPESVVLSNWHSTTTSYNMSRAAAGFFMILLSFFLIRKVRALETDLRSRERLWREVFENAPIGIFICPPSGNYRATNPEFQRMLGYTDKELLRTNPIDMTHPDDLLDNRTKLHRIMSGQSQREHMHKRYMHRDGHAVWVEISFTSLPMTAEFVRQQLSQINPGAEEIPPSSDWMIIAIVEDVSLRHEAEEKRRLLEDQLRQSQKLEALGTFASGIAHDFNNILAAILGYGERALPLLRSDAPERRYVQQVMLAGDRAKSLVERILTFSRSRTLVPVHLQSIVAETIELVSIRLPQSVRLNFDLNAQDMFVMGDPTHVYQVVLNLCSNAAHAMPQGGLLGVTLNRITFEEQTFLSQGVIESGSYLQMSVTDTGEGIPPEIREKMFNPFFTTRAPGKGTGLGLSLVDHIVRECGGVIDMHSTLGQGTRFDVYLPVTDASPVQEVASISESSMQGKGETVLIVDDEDMLVTLGEEILAELGYEPVGVRSSVDAFRMIEANPERFDLVITDQTMPELTGLELAFRIRSLRRDIPIILCSGNVDFQLESDARAAGVRLVLRKPLLQSDLGSAIALCLDERNQPG